MLRNRTTLDALMLWETPCSRKLLTHSDRTPSVAQWAGIVLDGDQGQVRAVSQIFLLLRKEIRQRYPGVSLGTFFFFLIFMRCFIIKTSKRKESKKEVGQSYHRRFSTLIHGG